MNADNNQGNSDLFWIMLIIGIVGLLGIIIIAGGGASTL